LFSLAAFLFYAASPAAESGFKVREAGKYPARQKQGEVVVGVKPYRSAKEMKQAFGKAKPYKYGILPVLLVITNKSDHSFALEELQVRFITADREGIEPVSGDDLAYFLPKTKPKDRPGYIPTIPGLGAPKARKGPLAKPEITGREFKAPVLAPHSSASGFFYYATGANPDPVPGSAMYISGIRNLNTGQELFYFEIPMDAYAGR
jgi:hypothetical protein